MEEDMSDHITVIGTIGTDPQRRQTAAGHTVAHLRVASTQRRRDEATGTWVDAHTNWYSVTAYRGLAEHALASLVKGQRVIVSGTFRLREWDAGGRQGLSAEIDADALGPDLLWGVAEFRRDGSGRETTATGSEGARVEGDADDEVDTAEQWHPRAEESVPF